MAEKPMWEQIGAGFVQHYYQQFDSNRVLLADLYTEASCLTWEGQGFQGKNAIMEKLTNLPFQKIQHSITAQDHQPTPDSCVISMVVGQLKICKLHLSKCGRFMTQECSYLDIPAALGLSYFQ